MSDVPIQLIVAAFQEEAAADQALKELKAAQRENLIDIQDAAVIRRDEKNKLHIKETADPGGGKGAAAGGAIGAVIGLIGGPAGVVVGAAAGALVGGVSAKLFDSGIPDDRLKKIGEGLQPGTSAIVAIIEHRWVKDVENQLQEAGADVLTEQLRADIAEQLAAGKDVSYTAVAAGGVVATERIAVGEDEADIERIVATDEGVVAAAAVITTAEEEDVSAGEETPDEAASDEQNEEKSA